MSPIVAAHGLSILSFRRYDDEIFWFVGMIERRPHAAFGNSTGDRQMPIAA
jgi:hypothetical protein